MTEIILNINPCSVNACYRAFRSRIYRSDRYVTWKKACINELRSALGNDFVPHSTDISVYIVFQIDNRRKNDLDNMLKSLFDACNGILWVDDSLVNSIYANKIYVKGESPKITIRINDNSATQLTSICDIDLDIEF